MFGPFYAFASPGCTPARELSHTPTPRGLYITSCKLPLCPTWNRFGLETVLRVDNMGPQQCGTISPCESRAPELVSYQIGQALPFAPDERDAQRRGKKFLIVGVGFSLEFRVKNNDRLVVRVALL